MATPEKVDPYNRLQFNMIHVHNTFKLGLERILPLLDNPPTNDIPNFLGYCEAWATGLVGHHESEELIVFPVLQTKIDMSIEIEQHKFIHDSLDETLALIRSGKANPSKFDHAKMKEILEKLKGPLFQHFDEEVEHIAPENMKVFEAKDLQAMMDKLFAHSHKEDPFMMVPYMLTHTAPEYKAIWPELPWLMKKTLAPYLFTLRHRGYWKYSPYSY